MFVKIYGLYCEQIKTTFLNSSCITVGKRGTFSEPDTVLLYIILGYRYNLYVIVSILRYVYRIHCSVIPKNKYVLSPYTFNLYARFKLIFVSFIIVKYVRTRQFYKMKMF
jgi:hypothetical protein